MDYKKVVEDTLRNGGFSELSGNYMVALEQYEKIVSCETFTPEVVKEYKKHVGLMPIGIWFNPKDNNVYLDVSIPFNYKKQALKFARENNQLAIYDTLNDESIYL